MCAIEERGGRERSYNEDNTFFFSFLVFGTSGWKWRSSDAQVQEENVALPYFDLIRGDKQTHKRERDEQFRLIEKSVNGFVLFCFVFLK